LLLLVMGRCEEAARVRGGLVVMVENQMIAPTPLCGAAIRISCLLTSANEDGAGGDAGAGAAGP
jgi:hypothetical protein